MKPRLFLILVWAVIVVAAVLTGAFVIYALEAMETASRANWQTVARFGSPMAEIGLATAALIAALGVLLVCIRYVSAFAGGLVWRLGLPLQRRTNPDEDEDP